MRKFPLVILVAMVLSSCFGKSDHVVERSVTLDVARQTPGVYIMDGDRFVLIQRQNSSRLFTESSDYGVLLLSAATPIQKIPNTAQLVLIGIESITFNSMANANNGYTFSYHVNLQNNRVGLFDWPGMNFFIDGGTTRWFETINGEPPSKFTSRMIYTRRSWSLMQTHGILTASENEVFTFGRFVGTNFEEEKITANRRFFAYPNRSVQRFNLEIERTMNGYFLINFQNRPSGYFLINGGNYAVVEFIDP